MLMLMQQPPTNLLQGKEFLMLLMSTAVRLLLSLSDDYLWLRMNSMGKSGLEDIFLAMIFPVYVKSRLQAIVFAIHILLSVKY